jgi:hypothetical protein
MRFWLVFLMLLSSIAAGGAYAGPAAHGPGFHERTDIPRLKRARVGRYLYLGTLPHFETDDLELYVSKLGLTLRVKAWIKPQLIDSYGSLLIRHWQKINSAFADPSLSFVQVRSPEAVLDALSDREHKAWLTIASQYMKNVLEPFAPIFEKAASPDRYKNTVLTGLLRYYLNQSNLTPADGARLVPAAFPVQQSRELFDFHQGYRFTRDASRAGYIGYLTIVYPIAATKEGPFDSPGEGTKLLGPEGYGTLDSRVWSKPWKDEFGGFPFIELEKTGIAFHGPITSKEDLDVWFLRRDYVSHGCMRMDSSDIIEFWSLLPAHMQQFADTKRGIRTTVMEGIDVTDWNGDGKLEAIDVAYYQIPTLVPFKKGQTTEDAIAKWMLPNAQKSFWQDHWVDAPAKPEFWNKHFLYWETDSSSGERHPVYWASYRTGLFGDFLPKNFKFVPDPGVFYNIPQYTAGAPLKRGGYHTQGVPIHVFDYPKNRIIQYRERGSTAGMSGLEDRAGKYHPAYFNTY